MTRLIGFESLLHPIGLIAQMVECLTEAQEVIGSIPIHSTHALIAQLVRVEDS